MRDDGHLELYYQSVEVETIWTDLTSHLPYCFRHLQTHTDHVLLSLEMLMKCNAIFSRIEGLDLQVKTDNVCNNQYFGFL